MSLALSILDLRFQLIHYFFVLLNSSIFFIRILGDLSMQILIFSRKSLIISSKSISIILWTWQFFFKVILFFLKISLSGHHLTFMLIHASFQILLRLGLYFLYLFNKLFFFQTNLVSFKFDSFEFISIFSCQLIILSFSILELHRLNLIFFIHCHDRF